MSLFNAPGFLLCRDLSDERVLRALMGVVNHPFND
jgi:hypothetical protein